MGRQGAGWSKRNPSGTRAAANSAPPPSKNEQYCMRRSLSIRFRPSQLAQGRAKGDWSREWAAPACSTTGLSLRLTASAAPWPGERSACSRSACFIIGFSFMHVLRLPLPRRRACSRAKRVPVAPNRPACVPFAVTWNGCKHLERSIHRTITATHAYIMAMKSALGHPRAFQRPWATATCTPAHRSSASAGPAGSPTVHHALVLQWELSQFLAFGTMVGFDCLQIAPPLAGVPVAAPRVQRSTDRRGAGRS